MLSGICRQAKEFFDKFSIMDKLMIKRVCLMMMACFFCISCKCPKSDCNIKPQRFGENILWR